VYAGDATHADSTSAPVSQAVVAVGTTVTLASGPNPASVGQAVTFTATVASAVGVPAGVVAFLDNGTAIGFGPLSGSGTATFTTSGLPAGRHAITAAYIGGGNFAAGASATLSQVVSPVVAPTGGLDPASDSGISHSDGITNVAQPSFSGMSQPLSTVEVYVVPTGGGPQQLLGITVADAAGAWDLRSTVELGDGSYTVFAQAVDQAGATLAQSQLLPAGANGPLVIDAVGPIVAGVQMIRRSGAIVVTFRDDLGGLAQATLIDGANYRLKKLLPGKPGQFLSSGITAPGSEGPTAPQQVTITFNGGRSLRGRKYLLTILSGGITDVAGNALDGEYYGSFPSGNGTPGGDFSAGLDAVHNAVIAPIPIPNGYATPHDPPRRAPSRSHRLLPVGSIHKGRLVVNHFG
jgi:hypothetical protein